MKETPRRFESRLPKNSTTPRLARLVIGLGLVLAFMFIAWQKAQERPVAPPPAQLPAAQSPVVQPPKEIGLPRVRVELRNAHARFWRR